MIRQTVVEAQYRLPPGTRKLLPRTLRDAVRQRVGPFRPSEIGFDHRPPALAGGEVAGPPDFVGIGVQKAGTTWWFELIIAHPEVSHRATIHKERHYFDRFATELFGEEQVANYHGWFPRPEGKIAGEWTPDYVYQPWVPPLLATAAPRAKLVMIVRDPVERFLSGLAHTKTSRASLIGNIEAEAVARGFYAAPLRLWRKYFPADQLLVLQYEQCVDDPIAELKRTYRFLGLTDAVVPSGLDFVNPTFREKAELDPEARQRLVDIYSHDVDDLSNLVPGFDVRWWPNFRRL